VLRDKLKDSKEKKDGKVVLKLEEDVDFEVMDAFLTFIYSGRLKDNRKDNTTPDPIWVDVLPQLVRLAVKVKCIALYMTTHTRIIGIELNLTFCNCTVRGG